MNAAVCGVPISGAAYALAGALVVAVVVASLRGGGPVAVAKANPGSGAGMSLAVLAAIAYGMCRLSEWVGMTRFAVVGFSVAALVVGVVTYALVGSIRSGRHGARISAVLDQIAVEDETAPVVYDGPDEDEDANPSIEGFSSGADLHPSYGSELVDEEPEEADPVLAPVVPLRRVA